MGQTQRVTSPRDDNWPEHSWRAAAARAEFAFYRPSQPEPDVQWAGGFGYDGPPERATTTLLGVQARIGGCEVSVETSQNARRFESRLMIMEALDAFLLDRRDPIELPWTAEVVAETRTIAVDGVATDCAGVRVIGGTKWSGFARVRDVSVQVTTEDPVVVTAIERCTDLDLPEFEPRA